MWLKRGSFGWLLVCLKRGSFERLLGWLKKGTFGWLLVRLNRGSLCGSNCG